MSAGSPVSFSSAAPGAGRPLLTTAPPLSLPLRHFAAASFFFLLFGAGLAFGAGRLTGWGFSGKFALGVVHAATLGWIAQTIFGAWSQMLPVHGETPLASLPAAKAGWWLMTGGTAAFIAALWAGRADYWIAAAAAYAGAATLAGVMLLTLRRSVRRDWGATHFAASLFWIFAAGLTGLLMAWDRQRGLLFRHPEGGLIAHAHMALAGFAGSAVMGAGYRLLPGIAATRARSPWEGRLAFLVLQAGTAGLAADRLFLGGAFPRLWPSLLALSAAAYLLQLRPILDGGYSLNPTLAFVLLGAAGGLAWAALGAGLAWGFLPDEPAWRAVYLFCALAGFYTPVILSQAHKIAPFLVWLHAYAPRAGESPAGPLPTIDQLSPRGLAWAEFFCLLAALPLCAAGLARESETLLRAGGALMLLCAAAYAAHTLLLLRHLRRAPEGPWTGK